MIGRRKRRTTTAKTTTMNEVSRLRNILLLLLPILVAFLCTPYPTQWGVYEALFVRIHPVLVGITPWSISSEDRYGFTFQDLYGRAAATTINNENDDDDDDDDNNDTDNASKDDGRDRNERRIGGVDVDGHTAIVTGANSGIGYEIALALARLGAQVTMACRNTTKCEAAADKIRHDEQFIQQQQQKKKRNPGGGGEDVVTTMTVDVSSLKSVQQFCRDYQVKSRTIREEEEEELLPLDMLFLNAGIGFPPSATADGTLHLSEDGIETLFATNIVGHHLLYRLLEPNLLTTTRRTTPARIVSTSSAASYVTKYPYRVATDLPTLNGVKYNDPSLYPQSKLAQILWTQELTDRLDDDAAATAIATADDDNDDDKDDNKHSKNTNVNAYTTDPNSIVYVNAANPGMVSTGIWKDKENQPLQATIMKCILRWYESFMWIPEEGALTLLYLGTAVHELQTRNIRGQYYHPQSQPMTMMHGNTNNDNQKFETKQLQIKLWNFLDELVADFV